MDTRNKRTTPHGDGNKHNCWCCQNWHITNEEGLCNHCWKHCGSNGHVSRRRDLTKLGRPKDGNYYKIKPCSKCGYTDAVCIGKVLVCANLAMACDNTKIEMEVD